MGGLNSCFRNVQFLFSTAVLQPLTFIATRGSNHTGPNRFKNVSVCFIIAKPLSIPQQTIFLSLHMVINHVITIFDFSRFLFATLTFWVVKSRRGSIGSVYPIERRGFFAFYRVQRTHAWRKRV